MANVFCSSLHLTDTANYEGFYFFAASLKKIFMGTVKCGRILNGSEFRESYIYGYLSSWMHNLGQISQTLDLL